MGSFVTTIKLDPPALSDSFLDDTQTDYFSEPYPYAVFDSVFTPQFQKELMSFLKDDETPWNLVHVPNFYEDYELVFDTDVLPDHLVSIMSESHFKDMKRIVERTFNKTFIDKVAIEAHKLIEGQQIRLHTDNDYNESHRIIIHLNDDWNDENGGFFVIFNSGNPKDIHKVIRPLCGNAVAFEIGPKSYHAVSKVHHRHRYSLVYTFYKS